MDFATLKLYYNRCNPYQALSPEDELNLDIDNFGPEPVRGNNWVSRLATAIERSDQPVCQYFTGLPGSGKSTELRRLAARLRRPTGAHLLPVLIDGDERLDLTNPIDIPDIIAVIVDGVERAVLTEEGRDPDNALSDGYLARLWIWLTRTEIELGKGELALPGGAKLAVEMRARPKLRQRVRTILATHLSHFLDDAREQLLRLEERAQGCGYRGLAVIFDSLEKLRGSSGDSWVDVLTSAERVFSSGAPYLRLPVHVLYTVPTALINRTLFKDVLFIPMIKLHDRDGKPWPEGMAAARQLVRQRLPDTVIGDIFGAGDLGETRVNDLIRWSGGYPRELVRLLQAALAQETLPLGAAAFQRLINELKDAYRKVIPADAFAWLARVADERYCTIEEDAQRQIADHMLINNAILRYVNANDWYQLHPAVADIPGVQDALAARRAAHRPLVDAP